MSHSLSRAGQMHMGTYPKSGGLSHRIQMTRAIFYRLFWPVWYNIQSIQDEGMENPNTTVPSKQELIKPSTGSDSSKRIAIIAAIVGVIVIAILVIAVVFLFQAPLDTTAHIRDIFIIFMALETLILGLVLITLVFQIARLTNLLQNEIKPILQSTNETISTLRGTTTFLSDNLTQPVIKINEYLAAIQQFVQLFGLGRKRK